MTNFFTYKKILIYLASSLIYINVYAKNNNTPQILSALYKNSSDLNSAALKIQNKLEEEIISQKFSALTLSNLDKTLTNISINIEKMNNIMQKLLDQKIAELNVSENHEKSRISPIRDDIEMNDLKLKQN